MNWKELATLKNAYDRRKELLEFQEKLKKEPLQVSEYKSLIEDLNLDTNNKISYLNHTKALRESNMVIDDIPETFEDFAARVEKKGKVPIRSSVMKQMDTKEFQQLTAKEFALFDDINGAEKVVHYKYRTKHGIIQETGKGISVRHIDTDDIDTIKKAHQIYKNVKEEIGKTLEEISVNSDKYNNYMKSND